MGADEGQEATIVTRASADGLRCETWGFNRDGSPRSYATAKRASLDDEWTYLSLGYPNGWRAPWKAPPQDVADEANRALGSSV